MPVAGKGININIRGEGAQRDSAPDTGDHEVYIKQGHVVRTRWRRQRNG